LSKDRTDEFYYVAINRFGAKGLTDTISRYSDRTSTVNLE